MAHRQSVHFTDRAMESMEDLPKEMQFSTRVNEVLIRYGELMVEARAAALEKLTSDQQRIVRDLLGPTRLEMRSVAEIDDLLLRLAQELVTTDPKLEPLQHQLKSMSRIERLALAEWVQLGDNLSARQLMHRTLQLSTEQRQALLDWVDKQLRDTER